MSVSTPQLTLGVRLLMARRQARLEQNQLAQAIGVSRGTISNWELDKTEPRYSQLIAIAERCDVDRDWLMGGREISQVANQLSLDDWAAEQAVQPTDLHDAA